MEEAVKLKVLIGEREEDLLLKLEEGRIFAEIGDRVYELQVREIETGGYLFFLNDQRTRVSRQRTCGQRILLT